MNLRKSFGQGSILAAALVGLLAFRMAHAVVPTITPTFSNSLNITSTYAPFQPGGVKVFQGNRGRKKAMLVRLHLVETRVFSLNGTNVPSHILREMNFEDGPLAKITDNFLAQGDDGNVYSFGKIVINITNNTILDNVGSWLVGGPTPADPANTVAALAPTVVMLGNPELGDVFKPEDLPPPQLDVTARVSRTNGVTGSGLGLLTNVLRIVERTPGEPRVTRTYVRGIGAVRKSGEHESLRLSSSTLTGTNLVIPFPTNNISASPTNEVSDTNTVPETPTVPENPTTPETPTEPEIPESPFDPGNTNLPPLP